MGKKRILSVFMLALTVLWAGIISAAAAESSFSDMEGHYAERAVETWAEYGVLKGYPDGSFRPDGTITRAELATVLDRIMGYRNRAENIYSDLPDGKWCAESILHLAAQGVLTGDQNGRMTPNAPITRQEAFTALARVLELEESEKTPGFADDSAISGWAKGYIGAMREAGYINGDKDGKVRPNDPISRGEVVVTLDRMVPAFVNEDGTCSEDCEGNLVVNAQDVTLKDMTVGGDLIVADGTAEGNVYLDRVTVKGTIVLRGCGENSFHIKPGCKVKNIIITKTTGGRIRLVNELGETIPMVYIDDGVGGVTLVGGFLGDVVVACDAQVTIASAEVKTLSVAGNAKVTVERGSTVARAELGAAAKGAALTVEGKVTTLVNDAGATVDNKGSIGSSGSGGSSGGSSGGGGSSSGSGSLPGIISKVTLQMLAPRFGEIPDTADVMGVGYTARTEWKNADGSPASYRWKENSGDADTFTANQAYQAIITLTPNSGYSFIDKLQVEVTDGRATPTRYTPAEITASGQDRVVKMVYDKTENKDPVSSVNITAPAAVNLGETARLTVGYWNNLLADSTGFAYQWYRCSDAKGGGKTLIAGAAGKEYTVPSGDTQNAGELYFCCEVVVQGKVYPSGVKRVEVRNAVDPGTLPVPVISSDLTVTEDGRYASVRISDLIEHGDVMYNVRVEAEVKKSSGVVLGNGIGPSSSVFAENISNGALDVPIDLATLISGFVPMENDMAFSSDLELGKITIFVEPNIRGTLVQEKCQEQTFDLTGTREGKFYIYTYETPDELWKGPSRDLQFVIRSGPCGIFVDKNDPSVDAVPIWRYQYVDIIYGLKGGWKDWQDGYYEESWDGDLRIWNSWLDGFGTGESRAEVRCAFYENNAPDGGMNIYYLKIKGADIVFDLENS